MSAAASPSSSDVLARVLVISVPNSAASPNVADCGKFKPAIAQRAGHEIIKQLERHAGQHECRQDLAGVAAHAQERRDPRPRRAGERADDNHRRQDQHRIAVLEGERERPGGDTADDQLTLSADIPHVGAVADREALRDQQQRSGFQHDLG